MAIKVILKDEQCNKLNVKKHRQIHISHVYDKVTSNIKERTNCNTCKITCKGMKSCDD
jgi:hypothetical protein